MTALALASIALAGPAPAAAQSGAETRIKAAFLYKFGGFVEWPAQSFASAEAPFAIGVLGSDPMADELRQAVSGRTVNGRKVVVRQLRRGEQPDGLHVLYIGPADSARVAEALKAVRGQAVLTVTETAEALALGSMITFVVADDKVRFDVALPPAEQGQLRISARLLAVARKVVGGPS